MRRNTSHASWRWVALLGLALTACDGERGGTQATGGGGSGGGGGADGSGQVTRPPSVPAGDAPAIDPSIFPAPGSTAFLSANENELLSDGSRPNYGGNARGELGAADEDGAAAPGAGQDPAAPPAEEAVPDPSREIVEADVYKLEGDLLYVLNRFRGLVIIDVSDPDNLRIRGRLPFQAMPVEMYVREGRAYIVMSDYFVYWQYDPDADPQGFHGSQVLIADISDPDHPEALGNLAIDGEISDTRMVGDVLYTVSKRRADYWRYNTADWEDRTWIVSLNVADPHDIREIDRITFQGTSTLIHVAHHAIFVAAWDPNFYLTDPLNEQETLVTYVDISDPTGDLQERGYVYIPGQIADKFKMDWSDGWFRVFSQRWREDGNITLHMVRTEHPDELQIDHTLELEGVTRSGLRATRFDGERAFAMTAYWANNNTIRELNTVDLSNPERPTHPARHRIEMDVTHFEIHGDRLLALGSTEIARQNKAALGLFDISDLAAPARLALTALGERYSSSEANGDYKALKTFPDLGLILIPLNYYNNNRYFAGMQIVEWSGDALVERGRVESSGGVRRAFPVGDRLVAVGEQTVTSIDATDLDRPVVTDALHLVRDVHDLFNVQGLQVQIMTDIYTGELRAEVREFGPEDDTPTLATLDLPFLWAPYTFRDGDVIHMLGMEQNRGQVIRNLDLNDPRAPRLRGDLQLSDEMERIYNQGQSFYARYWSPYAGLALRNQILPATFRRIVEDARGRRDFESEMRFIDLRDIDAPRVADGTVPMNEYPFVNKVTHGEVLFSTHVEQATTEAGDSLLYHVRSYVDRVDVSDPDHPVALPSINVPGYLVDVNLDGSILYTVDFQWDDFGRRRNSLNALRVVDAPDGEGQVAELVTVVPVPDQIHRAAYRGEDAGKSVWVSAHKYPWWGVRGDTVASRQPYTVLERYDFDAQGELTAQSSATLAGYPFDLLDVEGARAWIASRWPAGLMTLDISNPSEPVVLNAARTIGYVSKIVVNEDRVYAPMGWFGVHVY